jgi:hypothetical protein
MLNVFSIPDDKPTFTAIFLVSLFVFFTISPTTHHGVVHIPSKSFFLSVLVSYLPLFLLTTYPKQTFHFQFVVNLVMKYLPTHVFFSICRCSFRNLFFFFLFGFCLFVLSICVLSLLSLTLSLPLTPFSLFAFSTQILHRPLIPSDSIVSSPVSKAEELYSTT